MTGVSEAGSDGPRSDLFDRWLAHHDGRPVPEPAATEPGQAVVADAEAPQQAPRDGVAPAPAEPVALPQRVPQPVAPTSTIAPGQSFFHRSGAPVPPPAPAPQHLAPSQPPLPVRPVAPLQPALEEPFEATRVVPPPGFEPPAAAVPVADPPAAVTPPTTPVAAAPLTPVEAALPAPAAAPPAAHLAQPSAPAPTPTPAPAAQHTAPLAEPLAPPAAHLAQPTTPVTEPPPGFEAPVVEAPIEETRVIPAVGFGAPAITPPLVPAPVETPLAAGPGTPAPVTAGPVVHAEPPYPLKVVFKPRTKARAAIGVVAIATIATALGASYLAWHDRDGTTAGIAVTLWVLAAIIWAVHSGTSVTRMSVRGGQLDVIWHGAKMTFDLTSSYTPVEVHGKPGRPGWKVVFHRGDLDPFVIDATMVNPTEFMKVLRYYRPSID